MKKSACFFLAIIALVIVGCYNETNNFDTSSKTEATLVFKATNENVSPGTKTVRLDDGYVWWKPAEEISVFYGSGANGGSKFTSKNTTLAEIVEFEGSIAMSGSNDFWAVYPYSEDNSCDGNSVTLTIPANQTGVEGDFSDNCFPTVAKSKTLDLPFWNVCGGVKFFVSRSDIQSVKIKGNNNEPLAGTVKVAFDEHGRPAVTEIVDGATEVTLMAPGGNTFEAGKFYHITCLPTFLPDGITMTFSTVSETGTLISENAQTIKRSIFGVLRNVDSNVSEWISIMPIPEAVDLGLSVNWASFNVGASKPEEYGNYYAWAETETKEVYSSSTYKWQVGNGASFTKYFGTTKLEYADDAARANLRGKWRMPTDSEWKELMTSTNCSWTWTTENGINGYKVTSKKTGYTNKHIFLPVGGYREVYNLYQCGEAGYYWSSSMRNDAALGVNFDSVYLTLDSSNYYGFGRPSGFTVRPVCPRQ